MPNNQDYFNTSHCADPTAYSALQYQTEEEQELSKLIKTLKYIIGLSDFELDSRITLRHKRTGNLYK